MMSIVFLWAHVCAGGKPKGRFSWQERKKEKRIKGGDYLVICFFK